MKKYIIISLMLTALPVFAQEVIIVKNINSILEPAPASHANATCFMYKNNHFKCTCRFGDNSKLWVSKPLTQFGGELGTMNAVYGNIDACKK